MELRGATVLVTGAGGGIGIATCNEMTKPVLALAASAPAAAARLAERIGANEAWRQIGQRKGRI